MLFGGFFFLRQKKNIFAFFFLFTMFLKVTSWWWQEYFTLIWDAAKYVRICVRSCVHVCMHCWVSAHTTVNLCVYLTVPVCIGMYMAGGWWEDQGAKEQMTGGVLYMELLCIWVTVLLLSDCQSPALDILSQQLMWCKPQGWGIGMDQRDGREGAWAQIHRMWLWERTQTLYIWECGCAHSYFFSIS